MSTPNVSPRTIVRDTIISVLTTKKDKDNVRVPTFAISKKYKNPQETTQGNTYCVIVTDETRESYTHDFHNWTMQIKVVCYANHPDDPHGLVDGMIEDLSEAMALVNTHADLVNVAWRMIPGSITTDERTTDAGPWGQAVCTWTMDHTRK